MRAGMSWGKNVFSYLMWILYTLFTGVILVCLAVWVLRQTGALTAEMAEGSLVLGLLPGCISGIGK